MKKPRRRGFFISRKTMSKSPRPSNIRYLIGKLWKLLFGILLYDFLATWFELRYLNEDITVSTDAQAVASLFLGSLLALRINTSYNKWWEARTLWGRLVNEERNLAIYISTLSEVPREDKARVRDLLVEFPQALMVHLRSAAGGTHRPMEVSGQVLSELERWRATGWIDGWQWSRLALVAESLLQVCGGCERIRSSPLTRSYHVSVLACIWIYLLAAPLALHSRAWTIPLVIVLATIFFILELVASDIEEPFGEAPEDLPLERLCQTIRDSVTQVL